MYAYATTLVQQELIEERVLSLQGTYGPRAHLELQTLKMHTALPSAICVNALRMTEGDFGLALLALGEAQQLEEVVD